MLINLLKEKPFNDVGVESNIEEQLVAGDEYEAIASVHVCMYGFNKTRLKENKTVLNGEKIYYIRFSTTNMILILIKYWDNIFKIRAF